MNNQNNPVSFPKEIRDLYVKARETLYPSNDKITRARSRSISSEAEDLMAYFIYEAIENNMQQGIEILVDVPISYANNNKTKTVYPDIVIYKKSKDTYDCLYLCDLKMDPGWMRDKANEISDKHTDELKQMKSTNSNPKYKKGEKEFSFKKCKYYDVVLISSLNGSKKFDDDCKDINNKNGDCKFFVLTENTIHPNEPDEKKYNAKSLKKSTYYNAWIDRIISSL